METRLKLSNILHAYQTLLENRSKMAPFTVGRHLGYLEAGLQLYDCDETTKNPKTGELEIKRKFIKSNKWYKKDKFESLEQAIIRQTETMFIKNNIKF